jgi:hypothetical protein
MMLGIVIIIISKPTVYLVTFSAGGADDSYGWKDVAESTSAKE